FVDFGFKTDKIIIHHAIITKNENLNKIDESIILKPTRTQEYWIWTMDYNPELDKLNYLQIQEYPIKEFMITIKKLNTSQEIH
ncbi:MAG: hypothetical protein GON13_01020, partial [Nanoarchaeota archaeon]|nr:hypothetical protein [Nanoarchaeota archaeon]